MTAPEPRIRQLPPGVADAIAAGEVIERPASVVKELCENAVDAGARRIDVEIEGGGLVRIAVVDDGCGIAADELPLAVSRHATSKITSHHDLERIRTLGFRGEALASIAAVSDVRITSRPADAVAAWSMRVRAGEPERARAAGASFGTSVEVCELFATTPARLRFLRDVRAEAALATRMLSELALTNAHVAFTGRSDGRQTVRTQGLSLRDAARSVFGAEAASRLLELRDAGEVSVEGLISQPLVHRATRAGLVLVLNGRRVHNRALLVAVEEAYRGLLPQHRHPFGVVAVAVDPAAVDVNVHPTKREVRFRDERGVFGAVQRACWAALRSMPVPAAGGSGAVAIAPLWGPSPDVATAALSLEERGPGAAPAPGDPVSPAEPGIPSTLRALGQVRGEWIVAEGANGVVLIDPHAAHEKILYAQLLEQWDQRDSTSAASQMLLLPVVVDCDPAHMARAETNLAFLASCGFAVEVFGPAALRCLAVPAVAPAHADAARMLLGVLDSLDDDAPPDRRRHRVAALVACHAAVRFGDRLDPGHQQRLLDQMLATPGGMTCPHGRPTMLTVDDVQLRRAFRRSGR